MRIRALREHPHMRGEDEKGAWYIASWRGTSPHAWGRQRLYISNTSTCRNIPTCVGKTLKMLSKIKHLTFSKVPFSLTFIHFQKPTRTFRSIFIHHCYQWLLLNHTKQGVEGSLSARKHLLEQDVFLLRLCLCREYSHKACTRQTAFGYQAFGSIITLK